MVAPYFYVFCFKLFYRRKYSSKDKMVKVWLGIVLMHKEGVCKVSVSGILNSIESGN